MDWLMILGPMAKPAGEMLLKFAEKIITKQDNTFSILEKLSTDRGRLDFSEAHFLLFKEIAKNMPVGEENNIDNYSLFELMNIVEKIHSAIKEDAIKSFEKRVYEDVEAGVITWLQVTGKYRSNVFNEQYIKFITKKAIKIEQRNRQLASPLNGGEPEYPEKVYYSKYTGDISKKEEYELFVCNFIAVCLADAKTKYKDMAFISEVYYHDNDSVNFVLGGYGGVSDNEIILMELFNSTVRAELREGYIIPISGIMGTDEYHYNVSKGVIDRNVSFDLKDVTFIYSGIMSSIIAFYKLIKRHSEKKTMTLEIIISEKQKDVLSNALSGIDDIKITIK